MNPLSANWPQPLDSESLRRRVVSLRFPGDDIAHAPRPWVTAPPFTGLERELPAGEPMDHPSFPRLIG